MSNPLPAPPSPRQGVSSSQCIFIILVGLLLLVAASYSNTLYSPPILDDNHSFLENPQTYVQDFSISSLKSLSETVFGFSRLLPIISFAIDHHLANGSIVQYHITNILIHLLTTLAVFFFIKSITQTPVGSRACKYIKPEHFCLLIAALWALNPVQTSGVTYLVQRMASMATMFYLAAITFFIQGRLARLKRGKTLYYLCTLFFTILALLSKEISATIPLTILLIEIYLFSPKRPINFIKRIKPYQWVVISLCVIALLPVFSSHFWPRFTGGYAGRHFTLAERLLTESRIVIFYISLLLLPLPNRLNLEHDFTLSNSLFFPPNTFLSITLLLLFIIYALRAKRNHPLLSFGIFFFFINLAIESTVVPLELIFEHRLYLPSVGFFIVILAVLDRTMMYISIKFGRHDTYKIFTLTMIVIISVSSLLTTFRNNTWRDEMTLNRDILEKSPNKPRAYNGLGVILIENGQYDEGFALLHKAIELSEEHYEVYVEAANNIMAGLYDQGKKKAALEAGLKYIRETPYALNNISMHKYLFNLSRLFRENGRLPEAFAAIQASLNKNSNFTRSIRLAEQILADAYDTEKLQKDLNLVLTGDKQTTVCLGMAKLMMDHRNYEKATLYLEKAKELAPEEKLIAIYENRLQEETEKNRLAATTSSFASHNRSMQNRQYSLAMSTIQFIEKYYHPLLFTVDWLLGISKKSAPNDPFIALAETRNLLRHHKIDEAYNVIIEGIAHNPDFIPLYAAQVDIYNSLGIKQEAANTARKILTMNPGHPKWQSLRQRIASGANQKITTHQQKL